MDEMPERAPEVYGTVAAFLDGEVVDPEELRTALATSDGRDYLIDLLAITQAANQVAASAGRTAAFGMSSPRRMWAAAAAVALLGSLGAFAAGYQTAVVSRPGHASPVRAVIDLSGTAAGLEPPLATRVIRFEPGVNWNTLKGEQ